MGEKRVENRVWRADSCDPLLIHTGKSRTWRLDHVRAAASCTWIFGGLVGSLRRLPPASPCAGYPRLQGPANILGPQLMTTHHRPGLLDPRTGPPLPSMIRTPPDGEGLFRRPEIRHDRGHVSGHARRRRAAGADATAEYISCSRTEHTEH